MKSAIDYRSLLILSLFAVAQLILPATPAAPAPSATETWSTAALSGGTVRSLIIDPATPTTLYAAAGQWVFRTTNSGGNWNAILSSANEMTALAFDTTTSPATLFAASSMQVWRSVDGGANWIEISTGLTANVQVLKVEPTSHQLWAGTINGVWRYTASGTHWETGGNGPINVHALAFGPTTIYAGTETGLFRSFDMGANWSYTPTNMPSQPTDQSNNIRSIVINPRDTNIIVVGTWYGGIYLSDDGGTAWIRKVAGTQGENLGFLNVTDLTYVQSEFPNDPPILYAASDSLVADRYIGPQGDFPFSGIFRLIDSNAVWERVSDGLANRYVTRLAAHPTLPGTLYAGTRGSGVWIKTGTTSNWVSQSIGLNALTVKTFAHVGPILYAATSGDGVYRSSDNGASWIRLGRGLPAVETNAESLLIDEGGTVWMGHSRFGLFRLDGDTWVEVNRAVFGFTNVSALTSIGGAIIAAYQWNDTSNGLRRTVALSENRGASWREITNGLPSNVRVSELTSQATVSGIVVWASTENGLYRLLPGGAQWELIGASTGLTMTNVQGVTVDSNNTNILYAVGSSVFKSTDGGNLWSARSDGLGGGTFFDIASDPVDARQVYVTGTSGVLRLNTATGSWEPLGIDGPSSGQALAVATTGVVYVGGPNGVWRFVPTGSTPPPNAPRTVWGVLVYLSGDNDLDEPIEAVFNRLEQAANNPAVCIDVLWDRLNGPTYEYIVQHDTDPSQIATTYVLNQTVWEYGELDMGARATLEAYIPRARVRCPADRYMVAVVDHGGGWAPQAQPEIASEGKYKIGSGGGLSWDDTNGKHRMGTRDLQLALENATRGTNPIDVLFYDACLMGMFEEVYAARHGAHYLVASPNIAWGIFPYDTYVQSITAATSPSQLAEQIVSIYSKALPSDPYTIAAYDLTQADAVATALKALAQALKVQLPADSAKIAEIFKDVQKYDTDQDDDLTEHDTSVDLADLAARLEVSFAGTPVATAAAALRESVLTSPNRLVLHAAAQSSKADDKLQYNLSGATGLAIYFPVATLDHRRYPVYIEPNGQIELSTATGWGATIDTLRDALPPLAPEPDIDPPRYSPLLFQQPIFLPLIAR